MPHWFRTFFDFTKYGFIIRRFDRKVGRASTLWDKGYIRYPKAPPQILSAAGRLAVDDKIVIDEATLPIVAYLVQLVRADVEAYLGSDVRVDDIYMDTIPEGHHSVSGSWHTDNVGHRLKLYFCIEGYGDVPTCYRPGTNRRTYRPSIRDHRRFLGLVDFAHRPDEIRIDHATGDITLFDTNGEHRGAYNEHHRTRTCLLIEFADRGKSDRLASEPLPLGPECGFYISRSIAQSHQRDLMLDPVLFVSETDETYRYDNAPTEVRTDG